MNLIVNKLHWFTLGIDSDNFYFKELFSFLFNRMPSKKFYQKSKVAVASGFESGVCRSKENCPPFELSESVKSLAFGSYYVF